VRHRRPPGRRPAGGYPQHDCATVGCTVKLMITRPVRGQHSIRPHGLTLLVIICTTMWWRWAAQHDADATVPVDDRVGLPPPANFPGRMPGCADDVPYARMPDADGRGLAAPSALPPPSAITTSQESLPINAITSSTSLGTGWADARPEAESALLRPVGPGPCRMRLIVLGGELR
jgi:hypothetical protein